MATNYKAKGEVLQYTCGASETVSSGDVVFVNGIPGIAIHNIAANATGSIAISGVWEVSKKADAAHGAIFSVGSVVNWDPDEEEACVTAGQPMLGYAYEAAAAAATTVKVLLAGNAMDAPIVVRARTAISKYDLLYPSGYNADKGVVEVLKADADATNPARVAWWIAAEAISDNALGLAVRSILATGRNTEGRTIGDPLYLSTTAGGFTQTAPTGAGHGIQQVGVVVKVGSSDGEVLFMVGDSKAISANTIE